VSPTRALCSVGVDAVRTEMRRTLFFALLCWPRALAQRRTYQQILRAMHRCHRDPTLYPGVRKPHDLNDIFSHVQRGDFTELSPQVLSTDPWIVYFETFMSDAEVEAITDHMFGASFHQSESGDDSSTHDSHRHSETAFCTDECADADIVKTVLVRAGNITHVPAENFDFVQALRYLPGMYYREHHDNHPTFHLLPCGSRIYTMFVYLSDVEEGGETTFPRLNLTSPAKKGAAVLFVNTLDGDPDKTDSRTTHEAMTVTKGEKRGLNLWLYQYNFKDFWEMDCTSIELADDVGKLRRKQGRNFVAIDQKLDGMGFSFDEDDGESDSPAAVHLSIENLAADRIGVFWVGNDDEEVFISDVGAYQRGTLDTFPTHRLRLRRGTTVGDTLLREYTVAAARQQTLVVETVDDGKEEL